MLNKANKKLATNHIYRTKSKWMWTVSKHVIYLFPPIKSSPCTIDISQFSGREKIFFYNQNYLIGTITYKFFDCAVTISSWRVIDIPCKVGGINHINATGMKIVIKTLETQLWTSDCFPPKHYRNPNYFEIYLEIFVKKLNFPEGFFSINSCKSF